MSYSFLLYIWEKTKVLKVKKGLSQHTLNIFPSFKWYRMPDQFIDWVKCERKAEMGYKKLSTRIAINTCPIQNQCMHIRGLELNGDRI